MAKRVSNPVFDVAADGVRIAGGAEIIVGCGGKLVLDFSTMPPIIVMDRCHVEVLKGRRRKINTIVLLRDGAPAFPLVSSNSIHLPEKLKRKQRTRSKPQ